MADIDDIGGQVYPQGEVEPKEWIHFIPRDGEFYHCALAELGRAIVKAGYEPGKITVKTSADAFESNEVEVSVK
ncbi:MAG: hypothetical protein NTU91_08080 [Chloroflexi bacterium]|nr:hypothetical protein [Chloroflexota bacterium]